jgi:small subunit ribosomal protein S13
MARIVGVDIPNEKRTEVALTYIHGIGLKTSQKILSATNVDPNKRAKDLTKEEISRIYEYIEKNVSVEGALRQSVFQNIKRLKDIRAYRGLRHRRGLPVRGQNTKKNARTRKGKVKMAVGGLKQKLTKT